MYVNENLFGFPSFNYLIIRLLLLPVKKEDYCYLFSKEECSQGIIRMENLQGKVS